MVRVVGLVLGLVKRIVKVQMELLGLDWRPEERNVRRAKFHTYE